MKQRIRLAALLLFFLSSLLFSTSLTHSQMAPNVEQRVNALLARMTLEEKLGQLQQLDGEGWQLSSGTSRPDSQGTARFDAERSWRAAHQPGAASRDE